MKRTIWLVTAAALSSLLLGASGDPTKGEEVYEAVHCDLCHYDGGNPLPNLLPHRMQADGTDPIEVLVKRIFTKEGHGYLHIDDFVTQSDKDNLAAYLKQIRDTTQPIVMPITKRWEEVSTPSEVGDLAFAKRGGGAIAINGFRGKVVVFAVMFSGCADCQNLARLMQQWSGEMEPDGFQAIGVIADSEGSAAAKAADFAEQLHLTFPLGYVSLNTPDYERLLRFLQVSSSQALRVPELVLIDRMGLVRYLKVPSRDHSITSNDSGNLLMEIRALLGGPANPIRIVDVEPKVEDNNTIEGNVGIKMTIGEDGVTHDVQVERSLDPKLDQLAVVAVEEWRFLPAIRDGRPVPVKADVVINFKLHR